MRLLATFILFGFNGTLISILTTPIGHIAPRIVWLIALVGVVIMAGVPRADLAVGGLMLMSKALSSIKIQLRLKSISVFDQVSTHSRLSLRVSSVFLVCGRPVAFFIVKLQSSLMNYPTTVSFKEKFSKFSVSPSISSLTRAEGYTSK